MLSTTLPAASPDQLGAGLRTTRLLRAAHAAHVRNPRNAGLYAGALTITDAGATVPTQTTVAYPFAAGAAGVWRTSGGQATLAGGIVRFTSAVIWTTGGTVGLNNGKNANFWRATTMMNARYLALKLYPTTVPYRLLVDGQYVSIAGTVLATTTGNAAQYLLLDFAVRGVRRVTVEGQLACGFGGGSIEATGSLYATDPGDATHGAVIGDSYAIGSAATAYGDGLFAVMGDWLGATMHISGSGGTGWATTNAAYRFDERIAAGDLALGGVVPDFVVLMASINDRTRDTATIQANAAAGLAGVRAQYPLAPIIVFGCLGGATGPTTGSPSVVAAEQAVQAAVTARADPLVAFVPVSTDPGGAWVSGTGKIGTTTGTSNSDWVTTADGIHPGDEGHAMLGRRYASAVLAAINRMG